MKNLRFKTMKVIQRSQDAVTYECRNCGEDFTYVLSNGRFLTPAPEGKYIENENAMIAFVEKNHRCKKYKFHIKACFDEEGKSDEGELSGTIRDLAVKLYHIENMVELGREPSHEEIDLYVEMLSF